MAIKSIIDVEVNDGSFQRFAELFSKYQEQVKKTPDAWKKLSYEIETVIDKTAEGVEKVEDVTTDVEKAALKTADAFRQTHAQVAATSSQQDKTTAAQRAMERSAKAQASHWHDLAKSSHTFAGNITNSTRSLLRWVSITSVLGGLMGTGGLFGIDRLAASAGAKRRSAGGLGVTPGEESAFNLNYGRVIDPQHFLSGVNEALHDAAKRGWLNVAGGLTEKDLAGKDTAGVAGELLPALKKLADRTDSRNLNNVYDNRHLNEFMSKDDFQRLKGLSPDEFKKYQQQYSADSKNLNVADSQLRAWQDLQVQLKRAGETIENVFIKDLSALAGPIGDLSTGFTHMVDALLKAPQVKGWIEDLATGLEGAAKYFSNPDFDKDVQNFVKDVGQLATSVKSALDKIGGGDSPDNTASENAWNKAEMAESIAGGAGLGFLLGGPLGAGAGALGGWLAEELLPGTWFTPPKVKGKDDQGQSGGKPEDWNFSPMSYHPDGGNGWLKLLNNASYNTLEDRSGLPSGLLSRVEYTESRGRDVTSPAGAQGYFQFEPGTAQRYGVDVHDEGSSAKGAARYLRDLKDMFGGSIEKAIAAYNWGEGNLQKDIEKNGDRWREYLPKETRQYVQNVLGGQASLTSQPAAGGSSQSNGRGGQRVTITVNNNTGGSAAISTSQLAI